MARQSSKRRKFVHCYLALLFLFRAICYASAGAWIWAGAFALLAIISACSAYQAYLSHQAVESAWKAEGSRDEQAPPDNDAYCKKCPDCGKFTRDANLCTHCGHDFDYPPTRPSR